jgi:hypothetical protein
MKSILFLICALFSGEYYAQSSYSGLNMGGNLWRINMPEFVYSPSSNVILKWPNSGGKFIVSQMLLTSVGNTYIKTWNRFSFMNSFTGDLASFKLNFITPNEQTASINLSANRLGLTSFFQYKLNRGHTYPFLQIGGRIAYAWFEDTPAINEESPDYWSNASLEGILYTYDPISYGILLGAGYKKGPFMFYMNFSKDFSRASSLQSKIMEINLGLLTLTANKRKEKKRIYLERYDF